MSRILLALETSTPRGSVAVGRLAAGAPGSGAGDASAVPGAGLDVLAEVALGVRARHAETLMPAVDFALRSAGLGIAEVGGIVVGGGPGSFTGVRIAGATAKGLVRALDVPFYAYSGLLALAATLGAGSRPVCALFDARRGEVYAGCYRFPGFARIETILDPGPRRLEEVLERVGARRPAEDGTGVQPPLYAGDGALQYRDRIAGAGCEIAPPHLSWPRAAALLWLAALEPGAGRVADPSAWEPAYLRESGAERGVRG